MKYCLVELCPFKDSCIRQINGGSILQIGETLETVLCPWHILCWKTICFVSSSTRHIAHKATPVCEHNEVETHSTSFWLDFRVLTSCGFVDALSCGRNKHQVDSSPSPWRWRRLVLLKHQGQLLFLTYELLFPTEFVAMCMSYVCVKCNNLFIGFRREDT